MIDIVYVVAGLVVLVVGGELTVRGAVAMALRLGVSTAVIGLTVIGFGTSAPEFVVCLTSALDGRPDFAVGNVVGSNITNILLILGAGAVIFPLAATPHSLRRDGSVMIGAAALCAFLGMTGGIEPWHGVLMILALLLYIAVSYIKDRQHNNATSDLHSREAEEVGEVPSRWLPTILCLVVGLTGLTGGAKLLVVGAENIAVSFGVPDSIIGLTILAIGTSLPELFASVVAAYHKHTDIAVANVLGSNVFNVLMILGGVSIVAPLPFAADIKAIDIWVMLGASALIIPILVSSWKITRLEGVFLLVLYGGYMASIGARMAA